MEDQALSIIVKLGSSSSPGHLQKTQSQVLSQISVRPGKKVYGSLKKWHKIWPKMAVLTSNLTVFLQENSLFMFIFYSNPREHCRERLPSFYFLKFLKLSNGTLSRKMITINPEPLRYRLLSHSTFFLKKIFEISELTENSKKFPLFRVCL